MLLPSFGQLSYGRACFESREPLSRPQVHGRSGLGGAAVDRLVADPKVSRDHAAPPPPDPELVGETLVDNLSCPCCPRLLHGTAACGIQGIRLHEIQGALPVIWDLAQVVICLGRRSTNYGASVYLMVGLGEAESSFSISFWGCVMFQALVRRSISVLATAAVIFALVPAGTT